MDARLITMWTKSLYEMNLSFTHDDIMVTKFGVRIMYLRDQPDC